MRRYCLLGTALLLSIALLSVAGCGRDGGDAGKTPAKTKPFLIDASNNGLSLPAFSLHVVGKDKIISNRDFSGKVVLLTYFALWCQSCIKELADLKEFHEKLRSKGFAVVAIATKEDDQSRVKALIKKLDITYPVVIDNGQLAEELGGIVIMPTSFLVDRQGAVIRKYVTHLQINRLVKDIDPLLKGVNSRE